VLTPLLDPFFAQAMSNHSHTRRISHARPDHPAACRLDPRDRLVALFMTALDNLVVGVALPSIRTDLGGSLESLQWTVNAYVLAFAVFLLTGSALGDRFGRKRLFSIGLGSSPRRARWPPWRPASRRSWPCARCRASARRSCCR
jgi:hypothetical protein